VDQYDLVSITVAGHIHEISEGSYLIDSDLFTGFLLRFGTGGGTLGSILSISTLIRGGFISQNRK
jgi:hypothetical protein